MAMNGLQNLADVLENMNANANTNNEILIDPLLGQQAVKSINRMLDFAAAKKAGLQPGSDLAAEGKLFDKVGPA
jgi:quinolinate synthase